MAEERRKDLDYYMGLPYQMIFHPDPEGGYAVEFPELPGGLTQGETLEDAHAMAQDAKRAWLLDALNRGDPIPEPEDGEYSGRILLRAPKSLHKELVDRAKREGVSLNQFMIYQLSRSLRRTT